MSVVGPYTGSESPWVNPGVSASLGTQVFKGVTYNRYQVTWTAGQAWDGHVPGGPGPSPGASGVVAGGASFHVGTGFSGVDYTLADPIIITNVTLFDAASAALALHPRTVAFDSGALDSADGIFKIRAFNLGGMPLRLDNVRVQFLPRVLSIDSMLPGAQKLLDLRRQPFAPLGEARMLIRGQSLERGQALAIALARLTDKRQVVQRVTALDCSQEDRLHGQDVARCNPGQTASLFPATATYMAVSITDPRARHWDFKARRYVVGPVTSHAFLQFVGRHPDLNRNGVDDYIDVLNGRSKDVNRDGVPDEVRTHK